VDWQAAERGFDEALLADGVARPHYENVVAQLELLGREELARREEMQRLSLVNQGITFTVYGEEDGIERIFPFDLVPRILDADEWSKIEAGITQRITVLNLLLEDIYGAQKTLEAGLVPYQLIVSMKEYLRTVVGVRPRHGIYTHVVGSDLLRDSDGSFLVLEDNCRCPSGVSYVLENRNLTARVFPELMVGQAIRGVESYPGLLLESLRYAAPHGRQDPVVAVLTPGIFNSAYYEHSFLANEMGAPLVEGRDLVVEDDQVFMRTTEGRQRVDVIYRRVDDEYIDPVAFDHGSMLGVPGLMHAYRTGNVALANAPGAGIADNKAVYPCIPDLIRFFLDAEPLIKQVTTWRGWIPDDAKYIREHMSDMVVKLAGGAGGYGMLVGPTSSKAEIAEFRTCFDEDPSQYIAQHLVEFSSHPTHFGDTFEPRRIDLRVFAMVGERTQVLPGGLTRVALEKGSYVVNSSQGGGSKDTWVLQDGRSGHS
jgi:uncharacterized circularly permuted ATP-grasp superfamily protein